ncbi:MAG: DivIVA domain-containing protein [Candidatus Krumholzibacteriota bacterium]|nr:DivIVA domain-containing protein [Candidatus Krumholzibacteriota bacterium]
MRITPLDIRKQEFRKTMRGLDADEVYAFLTTVADEYEAVLSDNKKLREMIVNLEDRLREFKDIEKNLRNTLLTAERITAEAKENARKEAALILREAQIDADRSSESIRVHTQQLRREIFELKKHKDNYITRLRTLVESHQRVIDGFEDDFANVDKEIDEIGKMVEKDVGAAEAGPRMNRDKITEDFAHKPKGKVTWDEEKKREDMPLPVMPKPETLSEDIPEADLRPRQPAVEESETVEQPDLGLEQPSAQAEVKYARETGPAETENSESDQFSVTGEEAEEERTESDMSAIRRDLTDTIMGKSLSSGAKTSGTDRIEGKNEQVAGGQPAAQIRKEQPETQPDEVDQEEVQHEDDWKSYKVEDEKEDWSSYEVSESESPKAVREAPARKDRREDEVENALSGLTEMGPARVDSRADNRAGVEPEVMMRSKDVEPKMQNPQQQAAPEARPADGRQDHESGEEDEGSAWSMEELRKNLSNITNNEE